MKAPVDHPQAQTYWTKFEIMLRWHYDPEGDKKAFEKLMYRLKTGTHPSGARLHPVPIRQGLYTPSEVEAAEKTMRQWEMEKA